MSRAATSILAFGGYLACGAALLLAAPAFVCEVLDVPGAGGLWIRLAGMFFAILAFYCVRAGVEDATAFIRWTVVGRSMAPVFLLVFIALDLAGLRLALFGLIDLLAVAWTVRALRQDGSGIKRNGECT